ncbi:MAG: hypothetical protein NT150_03780, partial [Bacteroidetes bacterium]|nr:hypothetical protein [Bacteroidota bacterium]
MTRQYTNILTTLFYLLTTCNSSFGQIFNPDPFHAGFSNINIECTHQEALENKIKKITSKVYTIKKDGTKKGKSKTDFSFIEFNRSGNPTILHNKSYSPTYKSRQKISTTYDYIFEYDSLNNLSHVQEYEISSASSKTHSENDVYFSYDKKNCLISETVCNKYIYAPGFEYRGTTYRNDTVITMYNFNYDDSKKVKDVYSVSFGSSDDKKWLDTLKFNCSFDSVFFSRNIQKRIKKDSLGRI